ncbi:hypothetical protein HK104_003445 [Borealophlyctis nickersoniae]|nr:hypothetical protein HK104_003445 [Borealophlyctis nickersoniae]
MHHLPLAVDPPNSNPAAAERAEADVYWDVDDDEDDGLVDLTGPDEDAECWLVTTPEIAPSCPDARKEMADEDVWREEGESEEEYVCLENVDDDFWGGGVGEFGYN